MKKFLKTALAILPLAVMASCSDDPIPTGNGEIAEKSETRYLRVVISDAQGALGSRAADLDADINAYNGGTVEENKIRTLDFYFYDRFKNYHSHYTLPIDAAAGDIDNDGALDPDVQSSESNVYGIYHCNVPVELIQGETLPTYVICIVNAVSPNYYENKSMEDAQKTVLSSIYGNDHGKDPNAPKSYFGMSNSVYYGKDEVTGESNVLIMATPFDTNKLTTETELTTLSEGLSSGDPTVVAKAEEALKAYTVNIYVERYAVKVNLNMNTTTIVDYETVGLAEGTNDENTIKLTFTPKKWGVNAVERSFFFLKAFRTLNASIVPESQADEPVSDPGYGNEFETFATMDGILFKGWNNEAAHRCYWARTPGYYKNSYPLVADEVETDAENPTGKYSVEYFSYDQLSNFPTNGNMNVTTYTKETTMMKNRLTGDLMGSQYLPLSSIPSVLVAGQYSINNENVDFYIYGTTASNKHRIFSGETQEITGTRKILDKMLDDQSVLQVYDETQKDYVSVNSKNVVTAGARDMFIVQHPSEAVRRTQTSTTVGESGTDRLRIAADVVVLQIKNATDKFRFYNSVTGTYENVTAENINLVNRLLLQNLGGAHYYKNGMAFFSAPIQHWGWYRKDNPNRFDKVRDENGAVIKDAAGNTTDNTDVARPIDEWEWEKMETGDFGLVRNHIYTMEIGLIQGLGTGITDEDEPILPPADKVNYAVHFHVNIQKWAVLPTQSWNF